MFQRTRFRLMAMLLSAALLIAQPALALRLSIAPASIPAVGASILPGIAAMGSAWHLAQPRYAGTSGAGYFPPLDTYPAVQVIAGVRGCWLFIDIQHTAQPGQPPHTVVWRTYANVAAAPTLSAPLGPAILEPPVYSFDAANPPLTKIRVGGLAAALPAATNPNYIMRDVNLSANGFFHIGAERMRPSLWLAPNNVFHMQGATQSTVGVSIFYYLSVYIEEPWF